MYYRLFGVTKNMSHSRRQSRLPPENGSGGGVLGFQIFLVKQA